MLLLTSLPRPLGQGGTAALQSLHCPPAAGLGLLLSPCRAHGRHGTALGQLPWHRHPALLRGHGAARSQAPLWPCHALLTWFFTGVTKFPFFLQSMESGYGPELRRKFPLVAEQFCKQGSRAVGAARPVAHDSRPPEVRAGDQPTHSGHRGRESPAARSPGCSAPVLRERTEGTAGLEAAGKAVRVGSRAHLALTPVPVARDVTRSQRTAGSAAGAAGPAAGAGHCRAPQGCTCTPSLPTRTPALTCGSLHRYSF